MVEFIPIILIRVAFTTNLIYVVFKCNTNGRKCFFHILEYTLCDIYKCFPLPHQNITQKKIKCWIHRQKEIVLDPCRWLACFLNMMFYYPYHCPSLKIFMSHHNINSFSTNIQSAACMLLTSSRRPCPGWLFYVSYFKNYFFLIGLTFLSL